MSRLMSVAMTADAVVERRKTVTRRKGWKFLKPGDRLTLCRKVQGRKPGEPLDRLAEVEVIRVRRESLRAMYYPMPDARTGRRTRYDYGTAEVAAEGFPGMDPAAFVRRFFIDAQGMSLYDEVTRIEWRYLDATEASLRDRITRAEALEES